VWSKRVCFLFSKSGQSGFAFFLAEQSNTVGEHDVKGYLKPRHDF